MKIEEIYTPIENVKEILEERWNNVELRNKVLQSINKNLPKFITEEPHAFICRNIASPDNEFIDFLKLSEKINIKPTCLEYLEDKFIAQNGDKYCLGKMSFDLGLDKKGDRRVEYLNVIDFNSSNGKRICDVKTIWGDDLVSFHHYLFKKVIGDNEVIVFDFSEWIKENGKIASEYYKKYLSIFVCFGVLFENFFSDGEESEFTKGVIKTIESIKDEFDFYPIITKLVQDGSEQDRYWYSYQYFIKKIIDDRIN